MSPAIRHWFRRTWLRELLVAALLLQALIPAGTMPGVAADGGATLQLCSLDHLLAAATSPDPAHRSQGGSDDASHGGHSWCPFAFSLHVPSLVSSPVVAPTAVLLVTLPRTADLSSLSLLAPRSRLPRGPPVLS